MDHDPPKKIEKHQINLVRRIARGFISKLPANIELDDLVQVGSIGLLDAIKTYVLPSEASFETYATHRISGAMLDYLRETDPLSRNDRRWLRKIEKESAILEGKTGEKAKPADLAAALGISLDEYFEKHRISNTGHTVNIDQDSEGEDRSLAETILDPNSPPPLEILIDLNTQDLLTQAIEALPERERHIVKLRLDGVTMKEIGTILGVTESRICQIFARTVQRCQSFFKRKGYDILTTGINDLIEDIRAQEEKVAPDVKKIPKKWGRFSCPEMFSIGITQVLHIPYNLENLLHLKSNSSEAPPDDSEISSPTEEITPANGLEQILYDQGWPYILKERRSRSMRRGPRIWVSDGQTLTSDAPTTPFIDQIHPKNGLEAILLEQGWRHIEKREPKVKREAIYVAVDDEVEDLDSKRAEGHDVHSIQNQPPRISETHPRVRFSLPTTFAIASSSQLKMPTSLSSQTQERLNGVSCPQGAPTQSPGSAFVRKPLLPGARFSLPDEFNVLSWQPLVIPAHLTNKITGPAASF